MPFLILVALLSYPVLEVASIVEVSHWIGPAATFVVLAASAFAGAFLVRSQTFMLGRRVTQVMRQGDAPDRVLLDTAAASFAGMLLIVPGFISDILALFLLIPIARRGLWQAVSARFRRRQAVNRRIP